MTGGGGILKVEKGTKNIMHVCIYVYQLHTAEAALQL